MRDVFIISCRIVRGPLGFFISGAVRRTARRPILFFVALAVLLAVSTPAPQATAGEPPRAAGRKEEPLAIIVNKKNPIDNLSFDDLRQFCLSERKYWPEGSKVTVVLREPDQAERGAVLEQVYRMNEIEFRRYFRPGSAGGEMQTAPKELSSANGVRRFVFNVPGAIGFVRAGDVDDSVKVVTLEGRPPGDAQYRLKLPASNP